MDTSVIIEAYRTNCWNAVTTHFSIATVEKCYEETLTGDPLPIHEVVAAVFDARDIDPERRVAKRRNHGAGGSEIVENETAAEFDLVPAQHVTDAGHGSEPP